MCFAETDSGKAKGKGDMGILAVGKSIGLEDEGNMASHSQKLSNRNVKKMRFSPLTSLPRKLHHVY